MDFDDLLLNTVILLEENDDVRDYWQHRFRYVMIDEYQDTNMLQYQFSALIAGNRKNICVVGDDDQSIYKFRGATIENILSFEIQYPGCRTIRLEQNYRSTGMILDAANAVISNNTERKGKQLWTDKDAGDKIIRGIQVCVFHSGDHTGSHDIGRVDIDADNLVSIAGKQVAGAGIGIVIVPVNRSAENLDTIQKTILFSSGT